MDSIHCETERSEQPRPNRSLVIAAVALHDAAAIVRMIGGTAGRKRTQAKRGEKLVPAYSHDVLLIGSGKRAVREAYRKYLVGSDAGIIAARAVDHIVQTLAAGTDEARKASSCRPRRRTEAIRLFQYGRKTAHDAQGVVPQRIDFDRLADAWRDHPVTDFRIHPGQLHAGHAGLEQAVGFIDRNAVACSPLMPVDHVGEDRKNLAQRGHVFGRVEIGAPGLEEP